MKDNGVMSFEKIKHSTIPEMVANTLREAIISGSIADGVQLKQDELAAQLNISMSALREALRNLEGEGLVKFNPNRGVEVTPLSSEAVQEIFEIRIFLEVGALELSIPFLTEDDLLEAERISKLIDKDNVVNRRDEINWNFHKSLYLPAQRPKLFNYIQTMYNSSDRYMRVYFSAKDYRTSKSMEEHQQLIDACAQKNIKAAQKILRKHLDNTRQVLIDYLKA